MCNFSNLLLVSDFDRTLTAPDSTIPMENLEAIRYFMAHGGRFTVGTGRSVPMYRPCLDQIPTNAPLILYNGAAVYDYGTESLTETVWMPTGRELLEYLAERFPELWLEVQGVDAHYLIGDNPRREAFYRAIDVPFRTVSTAQAPEHYHKIALFGPFSEEGVSQFFRGTPEENAYFGACQEQIADDWPMLRVDRAALKIIDLQDQHASKGSAARALAQRLGGKTLVCVGDAMNDASMLREADFAFAPADCVPEVKALGCCTLVRPCAAGSVAGVVEELEKLFTKA